MYHRSADPLVQPIRSLRRRVLAVAVAALTVLGLSTLPAAAVGPASHVPIGHLDALRAEPGGVRLIGWAGDLDTPHSSLDMQLSFQPGADFTSFSWISHDPRPDVARAYPSLGQYHGINLFIPTKPRAYLICVQALDSAGGPSLQLGCVRLTVPAERSAIGHLDSVRSVGNNHLTITGWGADPDTPSQPITINVVLGSRYGNGAFNDVRLTAAQPRPDVAQVFPALGPNHGFALTVAAKPGSYPVCAYAFDTYVFGGVTFLGCLTVSV